MSEPIIGVAKSIADFAISIWDKSVSLLWLMSVVCGLIFLILTGAVYFQVPDASKIFSEYGFGAAAALIFFLTAAVFRSVIDYKNSRCLEIHFPDDRGSYYDGWMPGDVAEHARDIFGGRTEALYIRKCFNISNKSSNDLDLSSFDIKLSRRNVEAISKNLRVFEGETFNTSGIIIPAMKTICLAIDSFFVKDTPSNLKDISIDIHLFDQFRKKHVFKKIIVKHSPQGHGPLYSP